MSDEYVDNVVDLNAFREQKEREQSEKERLEKEKQEQDEIEQMRYLLNNIMEQLGEASLTGALFYAPMPDEEFYNHYSFESGYNSDGYYESTWEWDGPLTDDENYFTDRDSNEED